MSKKEVMLYYDKVKKKIKSIVLLVYFVKYFLKSNYIGIVSQKHVKINVMLYLKKVQYCMSNSKEIYCKWSWKKHMVYYIIV